MSPIPSITIEQHADASNPQVIESIKSQIATIAHNLLDKKDEVKKAKEMLESVLAKDEKYKSADDRLENAKKGEKAEKERVIRDDREASDADSRHQSLKEEAKDLQEDLDAKLLVYYVSTGDSNLEIGDEKFQLVRRVRIAPKQMSLFRDTEL